jgi:ATP-binding cassette subfamily B protein
MSARYPHSTIQCLGAVAQHHRLSVNPERLIEDYALPPEEPSVATVLRIAGEIGLKARHDRFSWSQLLAQQGVFPLIARLDDGNSVIVVSAKANEGGEPCVAVLNPLATNPSDVLLIPEGPFCQKWKGEVILLKPEAVNPDAETRFGFRWFIPEILKQKAALRDIAIAAMVMHVLAMASPIFFQLVIDKVLVHQGVSTLWTLAIGIVIALVLEAVLGFVRQLLTLAATNKIDMRLTRRTFAKLLSLPIDYFDQTTAGVITRHMQQVEKIRAFLTGRMFFTVLDLTALLMFVPLLFMYSVKLAMVVLAFALVIMAIIAMMVPYYNRRLAALYQAEGERQAMMVETIHGMRTVKSLAIEPVQRRQWDQKSAQAIAMHFRVGKVSATGNVITEFLNKLMPVVIIVLGAQDVFNQTLTVGALIGLQMIAGRVMSPLIAVVGLVNDYQETALSVKMLGEVMNRPSEGRAGNGGLRPTLQGEITFENVTFRYPGAGMNALNGTSFTIKPGSVVGLVGRSGSGKSTLTKLIQGLYTFQDGVIRFDGIDAREIELAHLRRQIGVVLQENFLFRGTVRDNIAMARPEATFEEIVAAAEAAGANEFIERMPQGYQTMLEENASNLSGGQKQRLSIARSLLTNPRILILDEAASALDPESEAIFIRNLSKIAVGRTVLMISHRLSTLVNADGILVMQHGKLMDVGTHADLLTRCAPYQQLWNQQTSHL